MRTLKLALKGILFWGTIFTTVLFISSIDSIIDYNIGIFLLLLILVLTLIKLNIRMLSLKDYLIVSGHTIFNSSLYK